MRIEETFRLDAPRDAVFGFLSDGPRVAACVPGVENFTETDDGAYEADLKAQLGPIKAMFKGRVTLDTTPPGRLEATGKGHDRASGSRAEIAFTGDLSEVDDGAATQVDTVADVTIRGRLGQFGTGVIKATATELIREFVACANAELTAQEEGRPEELAPTGTEGSSSVPARSTPKSGRRAAPRRETSQLRLLFRIVWRIVRDAVTQLFRSVRGLVSR